MEDVPVEGEPVAPWPPSVASGAEFDKGLPAMAAQAKADRPEKNVGPGGVQIRNRNLDSADASSAFKGRRPAPAVAASKPPTPGPVNGPEYNPELLAKVEGKSPLVARQLQQMATGATPSTDPGLGDPQMDAARDAARKKSGLERILSGARTASAAISRQPGPPARLDLNANAPVTNLMADRKRQSDLGAAAQSKEEFGLKKNADARAVLAEARTASDYAQKRMDDDPDSEPSKNARAWAVSMYGPQVARIPKEQFNRMTKSDIKMFFGEMAPEKTGGETGAKGKAANDKLVVKAEERAAALAKMGRNLKVLQDAVAKGEASGDIAGAGVKDSQTTGVLGFLQSGVESGEDIDVRQAAGSIVADTVLALSGKASSEQESRRITALYGLSEGATEARFTRGVANLAADIAAAQKGAKGSYSSPIHDQIMANGGYIAGDVAEPARREVATPAGPRSATSTPVKYRVSPDRKIRVPVMPDGTYGPEEPNPNG